ncbi:hypothetical protein LIER_13656 [Lithospermum erythrorhizon]|uniref:Uncharacterized protein n=1 Tax=Lithospermum erythrorhizon TaxID=34254 RepID=A0AAV3PZG1_LITER
MVATQVENSNSRMASAPNNLSTSTRMASLFSSEKGPLLLLDGFVVRINVQPMDCHRRIYPGHILWFPCKYTPILPEDPNKHRLVLCPQGRTDLEYLGRIPLI